MDEKQTMAHEIDPYACQAPPPPSYYESTQTAPVSQTPYVFAVPPLTHIDFVPTSDASDYGELINKANGWLAVNRNFRLHSCETITFPVKKGEYLNSDTLIFDPAYGIKEYRKALRCYLVEETNPSDPPQVLGTVVRMPRKISKTNIIQDQRISYYSISIGPIGAAAQMAYRSVFEPLSDCLKRLNEELEENPLPGKILKVETSDMKMTELFECEVNFNPDTVHWANSRPQTVHYITTIRVFYIHGPIKQEKICWKDVVPVYIPTSNPHSPKFEPFTSTLYKAGHWAYNQTGIRITNIQTLESKVTPNSFLSPHTNRPMYNTDRADFLMNGPFDGLFVKFIRVFYTIGDGSEGEYSSPEKPYKITHRPFIPCCLTNKRFEDQRTNIDRMSRWIDFNRHCSKMNMDDVICAETISSDYRPTSVTVDSEKTSGKVLANQGSYHVNGIRLYMNGMFYEPPIELLQIPIPFQQTQSSECCTLL